jgi:hypothetical protein
LKKIATIILVLVIAMAGLGLGWATWTKTLNIDGTVETGEVDFAYDSIPSSLVISELGGIGQTHGSFEDPDGDGIAYKLNISLENVCPDYESKVEFTAHNLGTVPVKIDHVKIGPYTIYGTAKRSLDLDGNGTNDIEVWWRGAIGTAYQPNDPDSIYDGKFNIKVLQTASSGITEDFSIELVAVQSADWE